MSTVGSLFVVLVFTGATAFGKPSAFDASAVTADGLTHEQAKDVLLVVLRPEHYIPGARGTFIDGDLTDDKGRPPHPGYYDFSVGADSPQEGAPHYRGLFSVSVLTGDVWEINVCKRFQFPQMKGIQKAIMKKTGKTLADERSARKGLGCTAE